MAVWSKRIFLLGTGIQSARTARQLRRKNTAIQAQHGALTGLLTPLAAARFWKTAGVEAGMNSARFKSRLPLCRHEDLAPAIQRMQNGEADVLWPGRCDRFATASGSTAITRTGDGGDSGKPKRFPVTPELLGHFRTAARESLLYYTARTGNCRIFSGRHFFLNGPPHAAGPGDSRTPPGLTGDPAGIIGQHLPASFATHCYPPVETTASAADWDAWIAATCERIRTLDLTLLAGLPNWLLVFAHALRASAAGSAGAAREFSALADLWPRLECCVHGGTALAPFEEDLRLAFGPKVNFHEVYPTSAAFIAAQDADARAGLRLMTDAGVFYEFLPADDFDEARLPQLGNKAIPLEDVRPGVDYALILTTPGGLCRQVSGDIVRFVSTEPPRLQWVGRAQHRLTTFGERISEKELSDAFTAICQRQGWSIVNFHVAPLLTNVRLGNTRGRHEWWVELKPGTVATPTGPQIAQELDAALRRTNPSYAARREGTGLDAPVVRLVMPGLFEYWLRTTGKWNGRHKVLRCRNDRALADPLAAIAQFAAD